MPKIISLSFIILNSVALIHHSFSLVFSSFFCL